MAIKASSLDFIPDDHEAHELLQTVVNDHYKGSLSGAKFKLVWDLENKLRFGYLKVTDELVWKLGDGAVDIVLGLNKPLYKRFRSKGAKRGAIDLLLFGIKVTGEQYIVADDPSEESRTRVIFSKRGALKPMEDLRDMKAFALIVARNPRLITALEELQSLGQAINDPKQAMLEFAAAAGAEELEAEQTKQEAEVVEGPWEDETEDGAAGGEEE